MGLFKSKEEREAARERQAEIRQLKAELKKKRQAYEYDVEMHQQSHAEQWAYLQVTTENTRKWGDLNQLGSTGWELVSASTYPEGFGDFKIQTLYVFKRRVYDLTPDRLARSLDIVELETRIDELEQQG